MHARAWGTEHLIADDYGIRILCLEVDPDKTLPAEYHFKRREIWAIVSGRASVTIDHRTANAGSGDIFLIPPGAVHGLINTGREPLLVYESRIGSLLGAEDRIRADIQVPPRLTG